MVFGDLNLELRLVGLKECGTIGVDYVAFRLASGVILCDGKIASGLVILCAQLGSIVQLVTMFVYFECVGFDHMMHAVNNS